MYCWYNAFCIFSPLWRPANWLKSSRPCFYTNILFLYVTFVLDLYQFQFLEGILNLALQANLWKPARSIVLHFIWCLNGDGHCFWLKMGYLWNWQCIRGHQQYRKACHLSANCKRLSPWHHVSWRQSCCSFVVSLLSLSSIHSSRISALSLNLKKSDNWKHLELLLFSTCF